jgi:hypothetical protein
MPDLNQDVIYRNFKANDAAIREAIIGAPGRGYGIAGCVIDMMDISDIEYVQFLEKRSESDGMDAGPVWAGVRRLRMAGTLYDTSRPLLMDRRNTFLAAFSPTLAIREEESSKGFLPLYYSERTSRGDDYGDNIIDLQIRARTASLSWDDDRDRSGGNDEQPLALPWRMTMIAKDPSIMGSSPQTTALTGSTQTGNLVNRGNYHVPLNMLFTVTSHAGVMTVNLGGSIFTLDIPEAFGDVGDRVVRIDGKERVAYIDDVLAMDVPNFPGRVVWPLVGSGLVSYTITYSGGLVLNGDDDRIWFWEGYA